MALPQSVERELEFSVEVVAAGSVDVHVRRAFRSRGLRARRTHVRVTTHLHASPTPNGGAFAIAVTDAEGNVEITEYDEKGEPVARTYG